MKITCRHALFQIWIAGKKLDVVYDVLLIT